MVGSRVKFEDIKPDDPWFASEGTQALIASIRQRRDDAMAGAVNAVRDNDPHTAARHVGGSDAYRGLIIALQPTTKEGT